MVLKTVSLHSIGLLRSTHKICKVCGTPASSYSQRYCWICFHRSWGSTEDFILRNTELNTVVIEPDSIYARFWYFYNETVDSVLNLFQKPY
jgi:predicted amidophosphoribosyltransferase